MKAPVSTKKRIGPLVGMSLLFNAREMGYLGWNAFFCLCETRKSQSPKKTGKNHMRQGKWMTRDTLMADHQLAISKLRELKDRITFLYGRWFFLNPICHLKCSKKN